MSSQNAQIPQGAYFEDKDESISNCLGKPMSDWQAQIARARISLSNQRKLTPSEHKVDVAPLVGVRGPAPVSVRLPNTVVSASFKCLPLPLTSWLVLSIGSLGEQKCTLINSGGVTEIDKPLNPFAFVELSVMWRPHLGVPVHTLTYLSSWYWWCSKIPLTLVAIYQVIRTEMTLEM